MDSVAEKKIHVSNMDEKKAGLHGCGPVREEEYLRNRGGCVVIITNNRITWEGTV